MNERIQELAEQAGFMVDKSGSIMVCFTSNGDSEVKKFAELIVRECLHNMQNCDGDLDFAIWKTKKDFGIDSK